MTAQERESARATVTEWQAAEGWSNREIGSVIGCSAALWSQIKNSNAIYAGEAADRYLRVALEAMREAQAREVTPESEFVETSIARRVLLVCELARQCESIGLVVAPSGVGKSAALMQHVKARQPRACYINGGQAVRAPKSLMHELGRQVRAGKGDRSVSRHFRAIRNVLAGYRAGGKADPFTIVIDEAQSLAPRTLDLLRNLHDDPDARPSLILAGTWSLDAELNRRDRLAGGYEQIRSRSQTQYMMPEGTAIDAADVEAIAAATCRSLGHKAKLSKAAVRMLTDLAQQPGHFRNVVIRLRTVQQYAEVRGQTPRFTADEIDYVAPMNGGTCQLDHSRRGKPNTGTAARAAG
jgi:DNA transposition AAA+ family ATPase